jgi:hypothetical protein
MTHYFYIKRNDDGTLCPSTGLATPIFRHDRLFTRAEIERLMDIVERYKTSTMPCEDIRNQCIMELDGKLIGGGEAETNEGSETVGGSWI